MSYKLEAELAPVMAAFAAQAAEGEAPARGDCELVRKASADKLALAP